MTVPKPIRPPHARLLCAPALHAMLLLAVASASLAAPPPALPALNIAIEDTSVSGISSGGFMSVQMQVAHSAIIRGAGIVAGGPYYCAQDSVLKATTECSCTGEPTLSCKVGAASTAVPELVAATRAFHAEGRIDDPAQIARQRVAGPGILQIKSQYSDCIAYGTTQLTARAIGEHAIFLQNLGLTCSPEQIEPLYIG